MNIPDQVPNNMIDAVDDNNGQFYDEEEEGNDEALNLKQIAETQQPAPQLNIEQHISKKKNNSIENSISIASVMEEICQEGEEDKSSQSSAVASLPASAGNNSRGLQSIRNADRRQVQGGSTNTSTEEEDTDDGDDQGEVNEEEEEAESSGVNDNNIDEDTTRM